MVWGRYDIGSIKKGIKNPRLALNEMVRITPNVLKGINNHVFRIKYGDGVDFMEKDWDNLIILDALRYDYFEEYNYLDGNLSRIVSKGAHSWEFMQGNFVGKELHDTVYVTANAQTSKLPDGIFYTVENLFVKDDIDIYKGTVLPEDMVKEAVEAHNKYPNKKLIVHFVQPHGPHLGPTAEKYRDRLEDEGYSISHVDGIIWSQAAEQGLISQEEARKAYSETLEHVLSYVEDLISKIDGKSVITSDHGQMLGEKPTPVTTSTYGHPPDVYTPELRVVPWFEVESENQNRRETYPEEPIGYDRADDSNVNDRLRALGYTPE